MEREVYIYLENGVCDRINFASIYDLSINRDDIVELFNRRKKELLEEFEENFGYRYDIEEDNNKWTIWSKDNKFDNIITIQIVKRIVTL